jgi:hypothetical protein
MPVFEVKLDREASSLRAVGVTPEFIRDMRSAGFEVKRRERCDEPRRRRRHR